MATLDFKQTHSWQEAIELGVSLVTLAESLPDNEQSGLGAQLHQLALDLTAQVAADIHDSTKTRYSAVYRISSALELVEKIYPALDTARIHTEFEDLVTRFDSETFAEVIQVQSTVMDHEVEQHLDTPAPEAPAAEPADEVKDTGFPVSPSLSQVSASPSGIPILGSPVISTSGPDISELPEGVAVTNHPTTLPDVSVPVTQAVNVQPNSLQ